MSNTGTAPLPLHLVPHLDDKAEDYACTDGDVKVGRVYRVNSIAEGGWSGHDCANRQPLGLQQWAGGDPG